MITKTSKCIKTINLLYYPGDALVREKDTCMCYGRQKPIKQDACGGVYTGLKTQHQLYVGLWAFPRRAGLVIRIEIQYFNNSALPKIMLFALAEEKE